MADIGYRQCKNYCVGNFQAMASNCEILVDTLDMSLTQHIGNIAQQETLRIEHKFSRYRDDNIVYRINHSMGKPVQVDEETAQLLDYAQNCYELSDGLFDITSGSLRKIWHFDGSAHLPTQQQISDELRHIGWNKVTWHKPVITLQPGMELDLGGIGKEYAVDQVTQLIMQHTPISCLVNFGGDIRTTGPRRQHTGWLIGIETTNPSGVQSAHITSLSLTHGAIATSGDAKRYLLKDGVRYSHILNPKTGWAVTDAPRSVTVAAATCSEAGILSTLALLQGKDAETFLKQQQVKYWCEW